MLEGCYINIIWNSNAPSYMICLTKIMRLREVQIAASKINKKEYQILVTPLPNAPPNGKTRGIY